MAFKSCTDYSKMNAKCHNAVRLDTFRTPSRLRQKGKDGQRIAHTPELIEISELSFATSMRALSTEVSQAVESLRQDVSDTVRNFAEHGMCAILTQILVKVDEMQEDIKRPKVDFAPVRERFEAQQELMERLEGRLQQKIARVLDELEKVQKRQELAEANIQEVRNEMSMTERRAGGLFADVLQKQQMLDFKSDATLKELGRLHEHSQRSAAALEPCLDLKLSRHLKEHASNMDFSQVLEQGKSFKNIWHINFTQVLNEISKVQQALNLDFAMVVQNHQNLSTQLEELNAEQKRRSSPFPLEAPDVEILATTSTDKAVPMDVEVSDVFDLEPQNSVCEARGPPTLTDLSPKSLMAGFPTQLQGMTPTLSAWDKSARSEPTSPHYEQVPEKITSTGTLESESTNMVEGTLRLKRVREYWAQTLPPPEKVDGHCQTENYLFDSVNRDKASRARKRQAKKVMDTLGRETQNQTPDIRTVKPVFADAEVMKKRAREALTRPQYNVANYYWNTGVCQAIARNMWFENLTFFVIFLNACWIAVDTDYNDASMLLDAHPVFQVAENCFCSYFFVELIIRFGAFQSKIDVFKDFWFVFDTLLVSLMVVETWVLSFILLATGASRDGSGMGNSSVLRVVRIVRMLRISRMARLLRAIPEIVIILKGIGAAARSVSVFFALWLIVIYIFAIVFRQITDGDDIGRTYFSTVPDAMNSLLLNGVLPDSALIVNDVTSANPWFWPIIMLFVLFASVTLMYMLLGVLVEVVGVVASTEKEGMTVSVLATNLREATSRLGLDVDNIGIPKPDFARALCDSDVAGVIAEVGSDAVTLLDMTDIIYEEVENAGQTALSFDTLVETVLNMRGTNNAKVKDVKHQLRIIKAVVRDHTASVSKQLTIECEKIRKLMKDLKVAELGDESDDDSGHSNHSHQVSIVRTVEASSDIGDSPVSHIR